jgi:hypothetical protein
MTSVIINKEVIIGRIFLGYLHRKSIPHRSKQKSFGPKFSEIVNAFFALLARPVNDLGSGQLTFLEGLGNFISSPPSIYYQIN